MIFLFTVLIFLSFEVNACDITLASRIIILKNNDLTIDDFTEAKSNCDQETEKGILNILKNGQASLRTSHIKRLLNNNVEEINLRPQVIRIDHIDALLASRHITQKSLRFLSDFSKSNSSIPATVKVREESTIDLTCQNCNTPGLSGSYLTVQYLGKTLARYWIPGVIETFTSALVAKNDINQTNSSLKSDQFQKLNIWTSRPEKIFTDVDKTDFYTNVRPIEKNQAVNVSDLIKSQLVKTNHPVKVYFNQGQLSIVGIALPTENGVIDQVIRLKNPTTHKIFLGKIIGSNTTRAIL